MLLGSSFRPEGSDGTLVIGPSIVIGRTVFAEGVSVVVGITLLIMGVAELLLLFDTWMELLLVRELEIVSADGDDLELLWVFDA